MMKKVLKYSVLIPIASLMYLILEDLGYKVDPARWETYVTLITGILISLGIVKGQS
ncbi:hypothetical protein [Fictibacillus sp. JL2B1089]|uniref:hypothetical protein n=1 Tax=Fictibacillus sp. JL2B1089 TaxID=3399565 RepID=UPI003A85EA57